MNNRIALAIFFAIWIIIGILAFTVNPAEALGHSQVNRCQEVLVQIATSHVNGNNPHPACVPHQNSQQVLEEESSKKVIAETQAAIPTASPEPVVTEISVVIVTEESTQVSTQPASTEIATETPDAPRTCNPNSPGDNTNRAGNHNCSGHQPSPNSGQENNKEN